MLWLTLIAFVVQPLAATAQVISAGAGNGPDVGTAQNGVPVVQIRVPSAAGVSHNQYASYSPTARGSVLNNSPIIVQSPLAGFIDGNAQLTGGPATVGALGGMSQEQLAPVLSQYLIEHGIAPGSADYIALIIWRKCVRALAETCS